MLLSRDSEHGVTTIFDITISDTRCPTYRGQAPAKVLAGREKAKKNKHLQACLDQRRTFTPLHSPLMGYAAQRLMLHANS